MRLTKLRVGAVFNVKAKTLISYWFSYVFSKVEGGAVYERSLPQATVFTLWGY